MFLEGFKNILTVYMRKPCLIELADLRMINPDDLKGRSSVKVLTGESYYKQKILEQVKFSKDNMEKIKKIYEWLFPDKFGTVTANEYDLHYSILTALHWYGKAMEESTRSDQLIALWISFNAIYSFIWRRYHKDIIIKKRIKERTKVRNVIVQSNLLKAEDCKEIIDRHQYMVHEAMPELGEKEYLVNEFGKDWRRYCNNPYGFDFWKHQKAERWAEALSEMISFIYGVRNGLFHGRWLPEDSELMSESVFVLHDVVSLLLKRFVENSIAGMQQSIIR